MSEQPQQTAPETEGVEQGQEQQQAPTEPAQLPEGAVWQKDANKTIGSRVKEDRDRRAQEAGFDSWENLTASATAQREAKEAEKSEADKLRETNGTVVSERDQLQNTLADMRIERDLERRLLTEGVPADGMDRVMRLADTGDVAFDDDGNPDKETLDAAIASVKETYPELFGEQGRQRVTGPDTSRPTGVPQGIDAQIADLKQQGKYAEAERLEANKFYAKQPG